MQTSTPNIITLRLVSASFCYIPSLRLVPESARPFAVHRLAFIAGCLVVLSAIAFNANISAERHPGLSAIIILLSGMPHGGFDVELAARTWPKDNMMARLKFIISYAGAAACVSIFWHFFPGESLCAFLGLSALHFSEDWKNEITPLSRLIIGASLLCFPAMFHQQHVQEIFEWLVPVRDAVFMSRALHTGALGLLFLAFANLACLAHDRPLAALETTLVLILAIVASPLTFFLFYFCALHSVRHLIFVRAILNTETASKFFRLACPYALAASAAVAVAALTSFSLPLGDAMLGSLFIGLAALTVPHMLLVRDC